MSIISNAIIAIALSATGVTSPHEKVAEVAVQYGDLDLTEATAKERLAKRIRSKAIRACTIEPASGWLPSKTDWKCVDEVEKGAFAEVEAKLQVRLAALTK